MSITDTRAKTHGDYNQMSALSQALKTRIRAESRSLTAQQQESIEMICVKIARIVCGDASEVDHWRDIAGYAELIFKKKRASGEFTQEEPTDDEDADGGISSPAVSFADR
jgi:hypothetical protein